MLNLFCCEEWVCAIRKQKDRLLFEEGGKAGDFYLLPNSLRYWCGDPFLIEEAGKTFVFFEAYDRLKLRGVIGYREIYSEKRHSRIKIAFDCGHHLSYPNICVAENSIYIIPESYVGKKVMVYKALEFPHKWEKTDVLLDDEACVDSTFIDEAYMLTSKLDECLYLYKKENGEFKMANKNPVDTLPEHQRCAGKIFMHKGRLIRPSQYGIDGYGNGIVFREILKYGDEEYEENTLSMTTVGEITYSGKRKYDGMHTYNFNGKYEVIDLKINRAINPIYFFARVVDKCRRTVKSFKKS